MPFILLALASAHFRLLPLMALPNACRLFSMAQRCCRLVSEHLRVELPARERDRERERATRELGQAEILSKVSIQQQQQQQVQPSNVDSRTASRALWCPMSGGLAWALLWGKAGHVAASSMRIQSERKAQASRAVAA